MRSVLKGADPPDSQHKFMSDSGASHLGRWGQQPTTALGKRLFLARNRSMPATTQQRQTTAVFELVFDHSITRPDCNAGDYHQHDGPAGSWGGPLARATKNRHDTPWLRTGKSRVLSFFSRLPPSLPLPPSTPLSLSRLLSLCFSVHAEDAPLFFLVCSLLLTHCSSTSADT